MSNNYFREIRYHKYRYQNSSLYSKRISLFFNEQGNELLLAWRFPVLRAEIYIRNFEVFIHYNIERDGEILSLHCIMPPSFWYIANWARRREITINGIQLLYIDFKNNGKEPIKINYDHCIINKEDQPAPQLSRNITTHKNPIYDKEIS